MSVQIKLEDLKQPRFGDCLRDLRIRAELTLGDFARHTEIPVTRLSTLESHRTLSPPTWNEIETIALLFKLSEADEGTLHHLGACYKPDYEAIKRQETIIADLRAGKSSEDMFLLHGVLICKSDCSPEDLAEYEKKCVIPVKALDIGAVRISAGGPQGASIELCPNGDIYINGRLAANDLEVVEGMRAFLPRKAQ